MKIWLSDDHVWGLIDEGTETDEAFIKVMKRRGVFDDENITETTAEIKDGKKANSVNLEIVAYIEKLVKAYCTATKQSITGKWLFLSEPAVLVFTIDHEEQLKFLIAPRREDEEYG